VNIGTIRGGTEANIIPGFCESELMFRLVGDVDVVKQNLEAWLGQRAEIEYGSHIPVQFLNLLPFLCWMPKAGNLFKSWKVKQKIHLLITIMKVQCFGASLQQVLVRMVLAW
jgi:hypothetical protein